MIRGPRPLAVLIVVLALAPGCAGLQHMMLTRRYINQQTQTYVYPRALPEVWAYARQLLFEYGYSVHDTGEALTFTLETEWRNDEGDGASRYLVQGQAVGERGCRVQLTRFERSPRGDRWQRDVAMEWMLLRRVDPEGAARIAADADRYAEN
jgi:hypothetical protein